MKATKVSAKKKVKRCKRGGAPRPKGKTAVKTYALRKKSDPYANAKYASRDSVTLKGKAGEYVITSRYLAPHTDEVMYCVELVHLPKGKTKEQYKSITIRGVFSENELTLLKKGRK